MAKLKWWIVGIAASPFVLFLLLTLLLYCPPVQRWAVGIATQYASEKTGMDISIGDVRLCFPLDLKLGGVKAVCHPYDSLPQRKDTIIDARSIVCEVQFMPLLNSQVEVDILQIDDARLNTSTLISDLQVKGSIGRLMLMSHGINLQKDTLLLNKAMLQDANLDICLSDTAKEDTTKTHPDWKIRFQSIDVKNTSVLVHLPGDTLNVAATIKHFAARDGDINLEDETYKIAHLDLNNSKIRYDNRFEPKVKGLDFNHIALSSLNIGLDSLYLHQKDIYLKLRACNAKEKSGLQLSSLTGNVQLDSTTVYAHNIDLRTSNKDINPYTRISGNINLDFNTFSKENPGKMMANLDGQIGKRDIMIIAGESLPEELVRRWPDKPALLRAELSGNMNRCELTEVSLNVPELAQAEISGTAINLNDTKDLRVNARLKAVAAGGNGTVDGKVSFAMQRMAYNAHLNINSLNISHFMPGSGMGRFTGNVNIDGSGTDVFSPRTSLTADARVRSFRYGQYDLAGATISARLNRGVARAIVHTPSDIMNTDITVDAIVNKRTINTSIDAQIHNIDFYALRLTKKPLTLTVNGQLDLKTDLNDYYELRGRVEDICITDTAKQFTPNDIVLDVYTQKDSTRMDIDCGDFCLQGHFNTGYKRLLSFSQNVTKEITRQIENRIIDEQALRSFFPQGNIAVRSGIDNPFARLVAIYGYKFAKLDTDLTISSQRGINGYVSVDTLVADGMQFDDVDLTFLSDEQQMSYKLNVTNGAENPNFVFSGYAEGTLHQNGTTLNVAVDDNKGRRGAQLALKAVMEQDHISLSFTDDPILGYVPFKVNEDNYLQMSRDMRVSADVRLLAKDGTNIVVYTDDTNEGALQDITLSVNNLNLGEITSALPFMPRLTGMTNSDFHLILDPEQMTVSIDADLKSLTYEDCPIGNLSLQTVYMPMEDGSHYLDGILLKDDEEVAVIRGKYYFEGSDMIDAELDMSRMPMDIINGFVPNQIVGMTGIAKGKLSVKGYVTNLVFNGVVDFSEASFVSVPYGIELKMDNKPVNIVNSNIVLENYKLTSANNNPVTLNGYFDFSDFSSMMTNMHVNGDNVLIINAKESRHSEAYGKGYVNFYAQVAGELSSLNVKATLDVLPSTNLYYILRDSPITTDNRLKELVTFTDFSSEETPMVVKPTVKGLDMDLHINVRDGSHITCWLNNNHTNYLDIFGNGELHMRYAYDDIKMTGRYTINQGEMKYSLPIIPLKTFTILPDSYIEFTGDIMNPRLSITATEEVRASASVQDNSVMVNFDCGVSLSKTLKDMGLEFIIEAKDNVSIEENLSVMSKEERGKIAVAMLTTGMYLDSSNTAMSTNASLSQFLQQGIINVAGSALKTIDLEVGAESNTTPGGAISMDYTFKFARRFWNNRISVAIGGKISTGAQTAGKTPSFFDNVEFQYRLSETSNQYLQLFYKHDVYDYLEGYLDHYGGGYMWRRKLQNFKDIFGTKKPAAEKPEVADEQADAPADTLTVQQE